MVKISRPQILLIPFFFLTSMLEAQEILNTSTISKPIVKGATSLTTMFYNMQGNTPRMEPYTLQWEGNYTIVVNKNLTIPVSFYLTSRQRNYRQYLNRALVSPTYKWVTVHLGYKNLNLNNYTMSGQGIFGAGIAINPKLFHLEIYYGGLQRAVKEDTTKPHNNYSSYETPSFRRMGVAGRLELGTQRNQFQLVILKARDDPNSIPYDPGKSTVLPSENLAVGGKGKISFSKSLAWTTEGGISLYTNDIRTDNNIPVKHWFTDALRELLTINFSSRAYFAYESALDLNLKSRKIGIKYQRIDPYYQTMGTFYLQSDIENVHAYMSGSFMKNKVRYNLRGGYAHNNIMHDRIRTTYRRIGSAQLILQPIRPFGIELYYSDFSFDQQRADLNLPDSLRYRQVTQNYRIMPRWFGVVNNGSHTILLMANYLVMTDHLPGLDYERSMNTLTAMATYQWIPNHPGLSYMAGINLFRNEIDTFRTSSAVASTGVTRSWMSNKLYTGIQLSYSKNYFMEKENGNTVSAGLNGSYRFIRKQSVNARYTVYSNNPGPYLSYRKFTEMTFQVSYTFTL